MDTQIKHISQIILPNKPQLDPLASYYLLKKYGSVYFTGIETAKIIMWTKSESPTTEEIKDWEKTGTLAIDVGGGIYDHHGKKQCATKLIAENLKIQEEPTIQNLLQYCEEDDSAGIHNKYGDLSYIIKCLYKQGKNLDDVLNYTMTTLEALQSKEYEWNVIAKQEFEQKAKIFKVKRGSRKLKIVVIKSDHIDIANYARQRECSAVVIQQRTSGHTFILTNKIFNIDLKPIIRAIRIREIELNGKTVNDVKNLFKEGKHPETPLWYYHLALNALLNGSDALLDTPSTKIPLEEIFQFVVNGISTDEPEGQNILYDNYGFREYKNNRQ